MIDITHFHCARRIVTKKKKNNICKEHVLCKINVECIKI